MLGILSLIGAFVLCFVIVVLSAARTSYSVAEGEISSYTITAPMDIVDEVSTNSLIEEMRAKVEPIYTIDDTVTKDCETSLYADYEAMIEARAYAESVYIANEVARLQAEEDARVAAEIERMAQNSNTQSETTEELPAARTYAAEDVAFSPADIDWQAALSAEQQAEISEMLPEYLSDADMLNILKTDADTLMSVLDSAFSAFSDALSAGVGDEDADAVKDSITSSVYDSYRDIGAESLTYVALSVENVLESNYAFDEAATKAAQDEAAASVVPITYKQGQNIVVKGEVVTHAQYQVLERTGLINQTMDASVYMPAFIYLLLIFISYLISLRVFTPDIAKDTKKMLMLAILSVLAFVFCIVTNQLAPNIFMIYSIAILSSALVSARHTIVFSAFLSFALVTVTSPDLMFFTESSFRTVIISISGSVFAAVIIKTVSNRAASLLAGLLASVPGLAVYLLMILMGTITPDAFGSYAMWTIAGGVFCGVVSLGLQPAFEAVFKITTSAKLIELADPRKKLLKRLMIEAPGTYHHSLYVGNLAENACEAIGANGLLARVGAYYHDIGKLKNPQYFVENQKHGKNPHDDIPPLESAEIITSHVLDGRKMGEKAKLPLEILNIISEHHGNTKVAYFLHEAKQRGENVNEEDFKYPAPRPQSRESAIIMLADSVEAAMRAVQNQTDAEALATIQKLIRAKYNDGQLDFTPLTLKDLDIISQAFAESYKGIEHKRIKYPDEQVKKDED